MFLFVLSSSSESVLSFWVVSVSFWLSMYILSFPSCIIMIVYCWSSVLIIVVSESSVSSVVVCFSLISITLSFFMFSSSTVILW